MLSDCYPVGTTIENQNRSNCLNLTVDDLRSFVDVSSMLFGSLITMCGYTETDLLIADSGKSLSLGPGRALTAQPDTKCYTRPQTWQPALNTIMDVRVL